MKSEVFGPMALSPSTRIRMISEISNRLAAESWALIDLTLKQFDLPVSDTWGPDRAGYVIAMIERAPDEKLLALGEHVGLQSERSAPPGLQPPFWQKGMFRLF